MIYKCRCSGIKEIMTNPKNKGEILSETTKTAIEEFYKENLYSRRHEFVSKYTEKGIQQEGEAIEFLSKIDNLIYQKNEEKFENDHLTGTPDIITNDKVIDIKCSWDCFTFPLFEDAPKKDYWYQLQGYMALTNKNYSEVVYCLMDAPEYLIESEARKYCYVKGMSEIDGDIYEEFHKKMTYSNLPDNLRIKRFLVLRDDLVISQIYERVEQCRKYLTQIKL